MKTFGFIICILAGALIGYLIPHHQGVDFANKNLDTSLVTQLASNPAVLKKVLSQNALTYAYAPRDTGASTEVVIRKDEAMKLIADFRSQNDEDILNGIGMQCRAPAIGSPTTELGGFFISRKAIDSIYKNDGSQKCTGLRIYLAKRPGAAAHTRFFTFIVAGTKESGTKSGGGDIEAPIIEHVDPCPQNCGQLRP